MTTIAPPRYVAPPDVRPYQYGLIAVVAEPNDISDSHWELGVQWEGLPCEALPPVVVMGCDDGERSSEGLPKEFAAHDALSNATPFTVYAPYRCSVVSRTLEDAEDRAQMYLLAREQAAVELAIATGAQGNEPSLQSANTTDLTPGGAVSLTAAIALLEQHIVDQYGGIGVIHMPRFVVPFAARDTQLERVGQHLETVLGTPVAAGAGYPGNSPGGDAPAQGHGWIYVTPAVVLRRSEVFTHQTVDVHGDGEPDGNPGNNVDVIAERTYVVGWDDCPVGAAQACLDWTCSEEVV